MVFSSISFLFIFLPLLLTIYFVVSKKLRNYVLLIASLIFYAWGAPECLWIILFIILINYVGSILIDRFVLYKKIFLFLTICTNVYILFYYKYFNFVVSTITRSDSNMLDIVLPLGISFYIFQAMSYTFDVYKKKCPIQKNIFKLALYICLFPQLVAGPIVKYHDIDKQIDSHDTDFEKLQLGIKRFIIGLSKKVLIANTMGTIADKIFTQNPDMFSHFTAWLGAIAYSFQIFFDFSGYSDMAIGLGLIFGFKFAENFNYPYISKSLSEFWRRWHMSLSNWFKEYLYIPLGGSRHGKLKQIRNLVIVFLITGIWHGAAWTFIVWGLWNALFIVIEKIIDIEKKYNNKLHNAIRNIYLCLIVIVGWVIFRSESILYAKEYIMNMFCVKSINISNIPFGITYYIDTIEIITFVAAILCAVPIFKGILDKKEFTSKIITNIWLLMIFILSVTKMASETYYSFIYFRF